MTHARNAAQATPPTGGKKQTSLAGRISGWTSSLLATGIVLVAAVGVGRQLTLWWRQEPVGAPAAHVGPAAVGDQGQQPLELTFGGGYSLRRVEHHGDLATALDRLRAECRQILETGRWPSRPAGEAELRFLDRTQNRPPLEEKTGKWQIHQFDGKLPLLVAIVVDSLRESTARETAGQVPQDPQVATPSTRGASRLPSRVAAWGLAMPTGDDSASLLIYEAGGAAAEESLAIEVVPLPAGMRRTVTLRGQGETSIGLAGDDSPSRTAEQLDALWKARGWTAADWRQRGAAWHNRYRATADRSGRIDVQLSPSDRGGVVGIMVISH